MKTAIARYLERRGDTSRPLRGDAGQGCQAALVVPALAESATLPLLLNDLTQSDRTALARTLVVVVVNNPPHAETPSERTADNRRMLIHLHQAAQEGRYGPLRLAWLDAASEGATLPTGKGVGTARKLGLDTALTVLDCGETDPLLVNIDADCRVGPDYLGAVLRAGRTPGFAAGVTDFAHPTAEDLPETDAVVRYETYIRYHALSLRWAGSPYASPAVGSTMVCRGAAYAAAGGMPERQAGEDFYFLERLRKRGPVARIHEALVIPSARRTGRTPFGTAQRVDRCLAGGEEDNALYHPASYGVLKAWLERVEAGLEADAEGLLDGAERIHPELAGFLRDARFSTIWPKLRDNAPRPEALLAQFHRWFDALKTLRLIHRLRDNAFGQAPAAEAVAALLARLGEEPAVRLDASFGKDLDRQRGLLKQLRRLDGLSPEAADT
jgi:hypothetical protein